MSFFSFGHKLLCSSCDRDYSIGKHYNQGVFANFFDFDHNILCLHNDYFQDIDTAYYGHDAESRQKALEIASTRPQYIVVGSTAVIQNEGEEARPETVQIRPGIIQPLRSYGNDSIP